MLSVDTNVVVAYSPRGEAQQPAVSALFASQQSGIAKTVFPRDGMDPSQRVRF